MPDYNILSRLYYAKVSPSFHGWVLINQVIENHAGNSHNKREVLPWPVFNVTLTGDK